MFFSPTDLTEYTDRGILKCLNMEILKDVFPSNTNLTNGEDCTFAGVEIFNCCFEPAYTIQHIVEAMKKVTGQSGNIKR